MGINAFFDAIAKVVDLFVDAIAEERSREVEAENSEKHSLREAFFHSDCPKTG